MQLLNKSRCYITGSSIIQAILNEEYKDSDIDIFYKHSDDHLAIDENDLSDQFIINPLHLWLKTIAGCANTHYTFNYEGITDETNAASLFYKITEFNINGLKIQMIALRQDVIKFIRTFIDLSICKVYYDGVVLHDEDGNIKLIQDHKMKVDRIGNNSTQRINKYIDRGFKLIK